MHFAFLFPGQGTQYPGMAEYYLKEFPYIRDYFHEANEVLHYDIMSLCLNGQEKELNLTANAQPSILLLSYCAFQILQKETGITPFLMTGHSLGEFSALLCSGAVSLADAVKIVRKRGELMQLAVSSGKGAMMAVEGLSVAAVEELCSEVSGEGCAVISNINSGIQIVISGDRPCIEAAGNKAQQMGAAAVPLKVSAPFHSPLMQPVAEGLEEELNHYHFSPLKYPVIANVTCKPYSSEYDIIPLLTRQVTSKVNWLKIMQYIEKTKVDALLEFPPKKTLLKFFNTRNNSMKKFSFDQLKDLEKLMKNPA